MSIGWRLIFDLNENFNIFMLADNKKGCIFVEERNTNFKKHKL